MWLFTTDGFYSAVAHHDDPHTVVVRSRVREDSERLAKVLGVGEVLETPAQDYRFRVLLPRAAWASYVESAALNLDYPNFKAAVAARQGSKRAHSYGEVWSLMYGLQDR